jgi:chemotaxis protein methyltransferase CheR
VIAGEPRARLRELATERLGLAPSAMADARIDDALARVTGTGASLEALASLAFDSPLWQTVIEALTIGETNFFRQPAWFVQLEAQVLRPIIERRTNGGSKRLRVWSAGCATGEETYSLAILISRLLRRAEGWEISIAGTDLSTAFLAGARRGIYREWSLREVDAATRLQHFRRLDAGRFELLPATRALVSFELLNLAAAEPWKDPRLLDLDLIVCRNVLMYLAPQRQQTVAQRLIASLGADGWVATAPAEATAEWFHPLTPVNVPSAVLFRREPPPSQTQPDDAPAVVLTRTQPAPRRAADTISAGLSDSAVALAAARRALDSSIRKSGE